MDEKQHVGIKSIYGEITGILGQLPSIRETSTVPVAIADQYNSAVDELTRVSGTDYSRHRTPYDNDRFTLTSNIRTRVGSLARRLEQEYGYGDSKSAPLNPVIVTVNQNQQLSVSITPIQQIIDSSQSEELRDDLDELKIALEQSKDSKKASGLLNAIQQKSWETFIAVLPVVLEYLGKR
jgi:hypothetical protein